MARIAYVKIVNSCIYLITCFLYIESMALIGEGKYNLNGLKEIDVKDAYLSLDQNVIRCQNHESLHSCTTKNYITTLLNRCGCLPFNLRTSKKVKSYSVEIMIYVHKHRMNT